MILLSALVYPVILGFILPKALARFARGVDSLFVLLIKVPLVFSNLRSPDVEEFG